MHMRVGRGPIKLAPNASFHTATVQWVQHWNEHLFSFGLSRPSSLRFRSGEFIMLGLQGETKPLLRAFSIASPSYADEIEFLSIKVPDGPLSSRLQRIIAGDDVYLARKPTGTLVIDALRPGRRLFLLATGTGLAPFLSVIRDPQVFALFDQVVVMHSVRRVSDLAYRDLLEARLAGDPLVEDDAARQLVYIPTVTREPFERQMRITAILEDERHFLDNGLVGGGPLDPGHDRFMLCGSVAMIRECAKILERKGFDEGSNAHPADFVIEKAFVG